MGSSASSIFRRHLSLLVLLFFFVQASAAKGPRRNPKKCQDRLPDCAYWASIGECDNNPRFMKRKCCISCSSRPECKKFCSNVGQLIVDGEQGDAVKRATEILHNCGAVIVKNVFDPMTIETLRTKLTEHIESPESDRYRFASSWFGKDPTKDARSEYLLPYNSPFNDKEFIFQSTIQSTLRNYLLDIRGIPAFYLEHSFVIRAKGGSGENQPKHQDNSFPGVVVQIPVAPISLEDGPTALYPCSHQGQSEEASTFEDDEGNKLFSFTVGDDEDSLAPLGSILMYVASVQHYGSANVHEGHDRDAIFLHYCKIGEAEPRPKITASDEQAKWRSHVVRKESDGGDAKAEL